MNNFKSDLAFAEENGDLPMWEDIYRQAFPAFESMQRVITDGWAQRGGIDRTIFLNSGKTLTIDEK